MAPDVELCACTCQCSALLLYFYDASYIYIDDQLDIHVSIYTCIKFARAGHDVRVCNDCSYIHRRATAQNWLQYSQPITQGSMCREAGKENEEPRTPTAVPLKSAEVPTGRTRGLRASADTDVLLYIHSSFASAEARIRHPPPCVPPPPPPLIPWAATTC